MMKMRSIISVILFCLASVASSYEEPIIILMDFQKGKEVIYINGIVAGEHLTLGALGKEFDSKGERAEVKVLLSPNRKFADVGETQGLLYAVGFSDIKFYSLSDDKTLMIEIVGKGPALLVPAVVVSDSRGGEDRQEWEIVVAHAGTDGPPVWEESPGSHRVEVGSQLQVQLRALNPEGGPVEYGIRPLPLPAGASLNSRTGEFEFRPQEGNRRYELKVIAHDGRFASTERLIVEVPEEGEAEASSTSWRYEYNDAGRPKTVYQE